jgi:formylmethanofuran dehydrogenase subunit D
LGDVAIPTPDGPIDVRFMAHNGAVLEVASTPATRAPNAQFAPNPAWSKMIIETDTQDAIAASQIGPNGEVIEVRRGVSDAAFNFLQEDLG